MLLEYEMTWTQKYFRQLQDKWELRTKIGSATAGASAYAARQADQWRQMALAAERCFDDITSRARPM